jgi:hypothetical protein
LGQHHIAQHGDVCIGFRLQTLCLCGGFQLLVVFKLRFLERVTIVVITAGHVEAFLLARVRRQAASRASPPPGGFYIGLSPVGSEAAASACALAWPVLIGCCWLKCVVVALA